MKRPDRARTVTGEALPKASAPAAPHRITEPEARTAYLALGPGRSMRQLAERYAGEGVGTVSAICRRLERWSTAHRWIDLAKQHDARVTDKVQEKILQLQADERFDAIKEIEATTLAMLRAAATGAAMQAAAGAASDLAKAACELLKTREVLLGGVSERKATVDEGPTDDALKAFLARRRQQLTGGSSGAH